MAQARTAIAWMTALLLVSGRVATQDGAPSAAATQPQWDVDATWEWLAVDLPEVGFERLRQWDNSSLSGLHVGLGRCWTTHLKSEIGITVVPPLRKLDSNRIRGPARRTRISSPSGDSPSPRSRQPDLSVLRECFHASLCFRGDPVRCPSRPPLSHGRSSYDERRHVHRTATRRAGIVAV